MTLSPPEEPLPNPITLGTQFQHVNIWGPLTVVVFIFYHCITKYHKFSSFRKPAFVISQFLWVRSLGRAQLDPLLAFRLTLLSIIISSSIRVASNGILSFFFLMAE